MAKLFDKDITKGVIGNAIFTVLWNGVSAGIAWYAAHSANLAPHWKILIGATVFFLLAFTVNLVSLAIARHRKREEKEREEVKPQTPIAEAGSPDEQIHAITGEVIEKPVILPCPYEWAHPIIESQRTGIDRFIVIKDCDIRHQDFTHPVPIIEFSFSINNGSIFSISIEDKCDGYIEFDHPQFSVYRFGGQHLMKHNSVKDCLYGNTGRFTIELRLSREEAEMISKSKEEYPNAKIKFDRLFVPIVGAVASQQLEPQMLRLTMGITVSGEAFELYRS